MCVENTPVERYDTASGALWVKREDLCCPPGPHFSKTRGVYAHALARDEKIIGVLDTAHSQGGWAVAQACKLTGRQCVLYYPVRKSERGMPLKPQQAAALKLGAELVELQAGRSAVLYHRAKRDIEQRGGYMYPNALKLHETVAETAKEFVRTKLPPVSKILVSASSGTIAAGVIAGARMVGWNGQIHVHMGYTRPERAMRAYIARKVGAFLSQDHERLDLLNQVAFIDEGYAYADVARDGEQPPFPCNAYYDLKAFRFLTRYGQAHFGDDWADSVLMWNIG